jgi:hypothetical protein
LFFNVDGAVPADLVERPFIAPGPVVIAQSVVKGAGAPGGPDAVVGVSNVMEVQTKTLLPYTLKPQNRKNPQTLKIINTLNPKTLNPEP